MNRYKENHKNKKSYEISSRKLNFNYLPLFSSKLMSLIAIHFQIGLLIVFIFQKIIVSTV